MNTTEIKQEIYLSKENIDAFGLTYLNESSFYRFYKKDELLIILDAKQAMNYEGHKVLAVLEDRN